MVSTKARKVSIPGRLPSISDDLSALFDQRSRRLILILLLLLAVAIVVSWIPAVMFGSGKSSPAPLPNVSSLFENDSFTPTRDIKPIVCNSSLTTGSERYSFAYLVETEASPSASASSSVVNSTLIKNSGQFGESDATYIRITSVVLNSTAVINGSQGSPASPPAQLGVNMISYLDQDFNCVKSAIIMDVAGQQTVQAAECVPGPPDLFNLCRETFNDVGAGIASVGAGTFNVRNYRASDNSTVSMSDIPLPIRMGSESMEMTLLSYDKSA